MDEKQRMHIKAMRFLRPLDYIQQFFSPDPKNNSKTKAEQLKHFVENTIERSVCTINSPRELTIKIGNMVHNVTLEQPQSDAPKVQHPSTAPTKPQLTDLNKLSVKELKELATKHNIKGRSTMKKQDLVDALLG